MAKKLIAFKNGEQVATGNGKEVEIKGLNPNTNYPKGTFQVAWDDNLELLSDVPAAKTKSIAATGVTLDKTTTTVDVGKTTKLTATVAPSNATNKAVTFSSGDTTIATVDNNGTVKGVKAGTVSYG